MTCPRCSQGLPCRGVDVPRLHELAAKDSRYLARLDPGCLDGTTSKPAPPPSYPTIPLAESMRLTALTRLCPYRSAPKCGCNGAAACALKGGVDVTIQTCWDCVKAYPI